jgi:hypothetical protein
MRSLISIVALLAVLPATEAEGGRAQIIKTVRLFELVDERAPLASDATLLLLDLDRSDHDRKRLWRDVPGSGVAFERTIRRLKVVRMAAHRATVDARVSLFVTYYNAEGLEQRGAPREQLDRIELRRIRGQWQIKSVARRVKN